MAQAERQIRTALEWRAPADGARYEDIRYELAEGIAKVTIDRPEVRNAFRPQTVVEISDALAFCSGGDQRVRGDSGYLSDPAAGKRAVGRFHVTDLHMQMRRLPKPLV